MEPFFFGPSQAPLYGVYEAAADGSSPSFGVLFCYPLGHEYMRSYRATRTLARQLAQQGVPSLRFDYHGTGDSFGERFQLNTAIDDTLAAIDILKERSGLNEVRILGLRLGGPIAVVAGSQSPAVSALYLWDPVVFGRAYLDNMLSGANNAVFHRDSTTWIDGYPLEDSEIQTIGAIDLNERAEDIDKAVTVISTMSEQPGEAFCKTLTAKGVNASHEYHPATGRDRWDYTDRDGNLMLCSATVARIQDQIALL